jgi:phosphohistidine phosphatase
MISSPAKRARKTAIHIAKGVGYEKAAIRYDERLYLSSVVTYLTVIEEQFASVDHLFLVGHNYTLTDLAEYCSGVNLTNVPTCGVVAIDYPGDAGFVNGPGAGELVFFDFPKNIDPAG